MLYSRDSNIEAAPLQDETILLQPAAKTFCLLNRTAAFIWNEMSEPASPELLAQRLSATFAGVGVHQARNDVESTLRQLASMGFVRTGTPLSTSHAIEQAGL
jgi:Coenzyme PQQ synthesis protein D (PqqD)